jgi:YidC/Oxa1 family membrane protein insertase
MQALNPKIAEIKEKYKDKPQQMNQEMAALYKKEKVNPLGGCLPIFIQMPIFIAFYGVLSKHFPLRGAPFFWWITDLSEPDSVLSFGTAIPLLNWSDLRLLPIIYIGTQLLSSKMMQTPNTSTSKNMKLMQYFLPIFFFFILYNAPSGLLIYWTLTNVFTAIQQKATSAYRKTHEPKKKPGDDKRKGRGPGKGPGKK